MSILTNFEGKMLASDQYDPLIFFFFGYNFPIMTSLRPCESGSFLYWVQPFYIFYDK